VGAFPRWEIGDSGASSGENAEPPSEADRDGRPQDPLRCSREFMVAPGDDVDAALRRAYTCVHPHVGCWRADEGGESARRPVYACMSALRRRNP
jgi:hypothetical protein